MKASIGIMAVAALISFGPVAQAQAQQPPTQNAARPASATKVLKRAEIDALLAQPSKVLVLDVRRPDELISIGGFPVYLSIQAADLEKQLATVPKDRTIITVSNHANRAVRAADLLTKNGFTVAGAAGVQDYEAEGGTLVKIAPRPPAAAAAK